MPSAKALQRSLQGPKLKANMFFSAARRHSPKVSSCFKTHLRFVCHRTGLSNFQALMVSMYQPKPRFDCLGPFVPKPSNGHLEPQRSSVLGEEQAFLLAVILLMCFEGFLSLSLSCDATYFCLEMVHISNGARHIRRKKPQHLEHVLSI